MAKKEIDGDRKRYSVEILNKFDTTGGELSIHLGQLNF